MKKMERVLIESLKIYLKNPIGKRTAASLAGGIAGFAYYYYVGCASGTCAITGNPYISTAYGAVIGYLLLPQRKTEQKTDNDGTAEI
jgi:presenilin-like A22 family membrane protease